MKTQTGQIPNNVGCGVPSGEIRRAITAEHTANDIGKEFTDTFGRKYTYTEHGALYHKISFVGE